MANQKQKDLEAGKRRLEEFRKKKTADRTKKGTPVSHDSKPGNAKQSSEVENARFADINGVCRAVSNSNITKITNSEKNTTGFTQNDEPGASNATNTGSPLPNHDFNALCTYTVDVNQKNEKNEVINNYREYPGNVREFPYVTPKQLHASQDIDLSISQSSSYVEDEAQAYKSDSSSIFVSKILPQSSGDKQLQNKHTYTTISDSCITDRPLGEDYMQSTRNVNMSQSNDVSHTLHGNGGSSDSLVSNMMDRGSASGRFPSVYGDGIKETNTSGSDSSSSLNHAPNFSGKNESTHLTSRLSFLDFLDTSRPPSGGLFQKMKLEKGSCRTDDTGSNGLKLQGSTFSSEPLMGAESLLPSSNFRNPNKTSEFGVSTIKVPSTETMDVNENRMDKRYEFYSSKQNEDFAALEQHIEDLTQEKFSLQRALEASQTLAESLAAENSSLTDSYNQQRSVVHQLKSEMEQLQKEIMARLVELESLKVDVTNAHLECNAADDRAKLLASEVISLEDKALGLKSNELKLENQLESAEAEIMSCRKKMTSLEKHRVDLQSTIDSLQEEKKVMQYKLQKVSGTAKSVDLHKCQVSKKEVSTSTEDININTISEIQETHDSDAAFNIDAFGSSLVFEDVNHRLSYENIPSDQLRTIENINMLISELSLEKEELLNALTSESSQGSKLKELNTELSRKLEVQTQKLELLTAQSMVSGVVPMKLDSPTVQVNAPYADEGDEVVERVLGWIMNLFPGGPSKRRTSKLL